MNRTFRNVACVALLCLPTLAQGAIKSHSITMGGLLAGDNNPAGEVAEIPMSFSDSASGISVNYRLNITLDWVDSLGSSVTGLTGELFGNPATLGANTQTGISPQDTGGIEKVSANGVGVFERVTFSVSDVVATGGTATFEYFSDPLGPGMSNALVQGKEEFSAWTGNNPFRFSGLTANFDLNLSPPPPTPNPVPEPGTWIMFGLLGALLSGRAVQSHRARRKA